VAAWETGLFFRLDEGVKSRWERYGTSNYGVATEGRDEMWAGVVGDARLEEGLRRNIQLPAASQTSLICCSASSVIYSSWLITSDCRQ